MYCKSKHEMKAIEVQHEAAINGGVTPSRSINFQCESAEMELFVLLSNNHCVKMKSID